MRNEIISAEFCVVGGGMAGLCAAIASARHGIHTVLMQDRAVLGGNASEEIRMQIGGAHGKNNRETGIIEEIILENYYRNSSCSYSVWDSVLYEKAALEPNITLLLDCTCQSVSMDREGVRVRSVKGWQMTSETYYTVEATLFADCSGDSILAPLTGAEFTIGRNSRFEFNESIAPEISDKKTMGMSCLFQIREKDHPTRFIAPDWANKYPSDKELPYKDHDRNSNFWWMELGGDGDSIHDTDKLRDELLKIAFGVWDHMKNHGDHGCENWELDWIGFLPGKRESRRYIGAYIVNQNDVESGGHFYDNVAYAGWSMDDHFPEGFNYKAGHPTIYHQAPSPWGIPYRSLYSSNINNLMFAGRNISVTHTALSSSRVMATCSLLGQAIGTAAAICIQDRITSPAGIDVTKLQKALLWDDCFIPDFPRQPSELTKAASKNHSEAADGDDRNNPAILSIGDRLTYHWNDNVFISSVRLIFDSMLDRGYGNMPCNYPLVQNGYKLPPTLIKAYQIEILSASGERIVKYSISDNRKRYIKLEISQTCREISVVPLETWGSGSASIFSMEAI